MHSKANQAVFCVVLTTSSPLYSTAKYYQSLEGASLSLYFIIQQLRERESILSCFLFILILFGCLFMSLSILVLLIHSLICEVSVSQEKCSEEVAAKRKTCATAKTTILCNDKTIEQVLLIEGSKN